MEFETLKLTSLVTFELFFFSVSSFLKRKYTPEVQNIKYRLKNQKRREGRKGGGKEPSPPGTLRNGLEGHMST